MRSSPLLFVCLGVAGMGLLLQIVGLATPNWVVATGIHSGLWKFCVGDTCVKTPSILVSDKLEAARAFAILGCLVGAACVALIAVFILVKDTKMFMMASSAASAAAALCILISFAVYASIPSKGNTTVSWSFVLCVTASVHFLVDSILLAVFMQKKMQT